MTAPRLLEGGAEGLAPADALGRVTSLLQVYRASAPATPQQRAADDMLRFAEDHPDALLRSCGAGHFTGSALVVDDAGERALFLFHRKLQRWLQPGGHADGDANLVGVAWREATEETGIEGLRIDPEPIDLDIHVIEAGRDPRHLHLDVRFLVVAPPGAVVRGNAESEELRWSRPDEVAGLALDDGTHRLIAAGLRRFEQRAAEAGRGDASGRRSRR